MIETPEVLSGPQGSGRSRALGARVERFVRAAATGGSAVVVDPSGTWRRRPLPDGVVLFDAAAAGIATLAALSILVRRAPGGMVAIDDCEMIGASPREWRSFYAAARVTGTRLVLVVPDGRSGIGDGGRTPSLLHAFDPSLRRRA